MTTFIGHACFVYILSRRFKITSKEFLVLAFFSMLPDIDIFLNIAHRTATHSIFLIAGVFAVWYFTKNKNILLAGSGLLSHVFLDIFDTVKIQLFYPLSYEFSFGLWPASNIITDLTALSPADYVLFIVAVLLFIIGKLNLKKK